MAAEDGAAIAVGVTLVRPVAEPLEQFEARRNIEAGTDARNVAKIFGDTHGFDEMHRSVDPDRDPSIVANMGVGVCAAHRVR